MAQINEKTYNRLQDEADGYISQFIASPYGSALNQLAGEDNLAALIKGFTGIAYTHYERTPKRWTADMAQDVISYDLLDHMDFSALFVNAVVPVLVNYFIFLEKEVHYIKNSAALVKGVVDGSMFFYEENYAPIDESEVENIPDEVVEQLKGEVGQQLLRDSDPGEVKMMKEQYELLKNLQRDDYLDEDEQKMLEILDGLFGKSAQQSESKRAGQAQMKLHKKKK